MSSNEGNTEMKNDLHMACKSNLNLKQAMMCCHCLFLSLRRLNLSLGDRSVFVLSFWLGFGVSALRQATDFSVSNF